MPSFAFPARAFAAAFALMSLVAAVPPVAADAAPDLIVQEVRPGSSRPVAGDPLQFTGGFYANGSIPFGFFARFYVDGALVSEYRYANATGAHGLTSQRWNATEGNHTVRFVVDGDDEVPETNESNNVAEASFFVYPSVGLPDLVANHLYRYDGGPATPGTLMTFVGEFGNPSNASAGDFDIAFAVDGGERVRYRVFVGSGRVSNRVFHWDAVPGAHWINFTVDAAGEITESNETNNKRSLFVFVANATPLPDLVVTNLTPIPASPREGDNVTVVTTIRNVGGNATGNVSVDLYLDGNTLLGTRIVPIPPPGLNRTVVLGWADAHEGSHSLTAIVDDPNRIPESNETNNKLLRLVDVGPATHNVAALLPYGPWNATEGDFVPLRGLLLNVGNSTLRDVRGDLYLDGDRIASRTFPSLGRNQSASVVAPWYATPGVHSLVFIADPADVINETNEYDNFAQDLFYVLPRVDLGVKILSVEKEPLRTDVGDAPNPHARRFVRVEVTNYQNDTLFAAVVLSASATTRHLEVGTTSVADEAGVPLRPYESRVVELVWDPLLTVGDATLTARVFSWGTYDERPENDEDSARDFVLVGGLGGATVA